MKTVVFCLEEPSAKAMLEGVLPRLLPDITARFLVFEGKQDLHKQLERKIKLWQGDAHFVVMRDQDSGDCIKIKNELRNLCVSAGRPDALIRIACRELESFYLGDLTAVENGLGISGLAKQQASRKFREPDRLVNASEELKKITKNEYQKVDGSRRIGPHLSLDGRNKNCSSSFIALIDGLISRLQ